MVCYCMNVMSIASLYIIHKAVQRAKKQGRKPYPENFNEWITLLFAIVVVILISYFLVLLLNRDFLNELNIPVLSLF